MSQEVTEPLVFVAPPSVARSGARPLLGAIVMVPIAVGAYLLARHFGLNPRALDLVGACPLVIGVMMLFAWLAARRATLRVSVDSVSISVSSRGREVKLAWSQIAWVEEGTSRWIPLPQLRLFGADGRILADITNHIADFDLLKSAIVKHVVPDVANAPTEIKHYRRGAWYVVGLGTLMLAVAGYLVWSVGTELLGRRRLSTHGVAGTGVVVRKFITPNGQTHRIEYRVDAPGAPLKDLEIEPRLWTEIEDGEWLPVIYVPGNPGLCRLRQGQVDHTSDSQVVIQLAGAGVACLFALYVGTKGMLALRAMPAREGEQTR